MAFENLTDKLQNVFKNLRSKGRLSEEDVKAALKEVRMALLEADVNYKVVKDFTKAIQEKAVGTNVLNGLNPAQMVIKLVNEELCAMMGTEQTSLSFRSGQNITVIMMMGLQGAGKTTSSAKLAAKLKKKGKNSLLAACDVYRPAAIEQLKINGAKHDIPVFDMGTDAKPLEIARESLGYAKKLACDVVILDTAGRLHVDSALMDELAEIRNNIDIADRVLVLDAMTGQDAVNTALAFDEKIGIDGVILTKLDGDARGGAALSLRAVTGKPIIYTGVGEKLTDFEEFYPDRMANRILGMGDVLSVIEKAEELIDDKEALALSQKIKKNEFDYNDYLTSMQQMEKMGGIGSLLSMLPGIMPKVNKNQMSAIENSIDDRTMKQNQAIILSMTKGERENPDIMSPSRKHRIAKGCGLDIAQVNRFVKQFNETRKVMKSMMGKKGKMKLPFAF